MTVSLSKPEPVAEIPWTKFWDMSSGGGRKEPYEAIYIQAPQDQAIVVFYNRFGHNPERVTCSCCGSDYSIEESPTLADASAYHRNCSHAYFYLDTNQEVAGDVTFRDLTWNSAENTHHYKGRPVESRYVERRDISEHSRWAPHITVGDYSKQDNILVIADSDIAPHERRGSVPEQGYVWRG